MNKVRSNDRILLLKASENVTSSTGLVDPRLFTGENKLHVLQDSKGTLWSFKYEHGGLPGALKQRFTSFDYAYDHAKRYFKNRGIEVVGIID